MPKPRRRVEPENKPRCIGIVGSRRRDSDKDFRDCLESFTNLYKWGDTIVSGGCPKGGDRFAEIIAKDHGLTITIHYPNWNKYGRGAGFERNGKIAKNCDILLAVVAKDR